MTREQWLLPLFQELGYGRLQRVRTIVIEEKEYPISHMWLHSPIHGERAKRAIGIAFLLRRKDEFDKLVKLKTKFLEERNDFGLGGFISFSHELAQRWTDRLA